MPETELISVESIKPSKTNVRREIAKDELAELAASIKEHGILEPLLVQPLPTGGHEIIAGERRWRAAKSAGLAKVPCTVHAVGDVEALEMQITENLQREGIGPLEEAEAFQSLLKLHNGTRDAVLAKKPVGALDLAKLDVQGLAKRIGKSKEYVYSRLKLLKLAPPVQKALAAEKIDAGHAVELVPLKPEQQKQVLATMTGPYALPMSVQDLRAEIKERYGPKPAPPEVSAKERARRKHEAELSKKRQAAWDRSQKKREEERLLDERVDAEMLRQLWPKLHGAHELALAHVLAAGVGRESRSTGEALLIAAGKPIPERGAPANPKEFARQPRGRLLALAVLAFVSDSWDAKFVAEVCRKFGLDRKKIRAELLQADAAAAAKAKAAALPPAKAALRRAGLRTSAKAPKPSILAAKAGKAPAKKSARRKRSARS